MTSAAGDTWLTFQLDVPGPRRLAPAQIAPGLAVCCPALRAQHFWNHFRHPNVLPAIAAVSQVALCLPAIRGYSVPSASFYRLSNRTSRAII